MRRAALVLINLYQRFVSPYKGFSCAYRVHTGRAGCSALGYRAIRRYGVIAGIRVLGKRTNLCGVAHRRFKPVTGRLPFSSQRGVCDIGCDLPCHSGCDIPTCSECDLPAGGIFSRVLEFSDCCNCCGCDWPSSKRSRRDSERDYVYIPPNSRWRKEKSEA